jgi:hypothetical protein
MGRRSTLPIRIGVMLLTLPRAAQIAKAVVDAAGLALTLTKR